MGTPKITKEEETEGDRSNTQVLQKEGLLFVGY
jgi:hypothetical protein